ncbi:NAD-dependent epimerase/dehydratase family protein [Xanthobacter wiegelii]|uniref:NAD-dependent epimerase/dehydratase family protein n=1 Tax=Xanthobacter wiegelii TaxID=3119913 RepID=UPI003726A7C3
MSRKVLITGGAGFIGSRLALRLLADGHDVVVLDNLSPQIHGANPEESPLYRSIEGKVKILKGDVCSRDALREALAGRDSVVHLAAETGTGQSMYQIEHYVNVNIGATGILLDILANEKHEVKRVVIASSRSVYGEGKYISKELGAVYPEHRSVEDMKAGDFEVKYPGSSALQIAATDEDSKLHPSSVYGITKQVQEQLIMTACPSLGVEAVALRYQNVYGPGQSLSNPYTGILSIFSNLIMSGKPINIFEDGTESRDFVYIDDIVAATTLALTSDSAVGHVFNVGSGVPTDVLTVANLLNEKLGGSSPISISGNFRLGDIRHNYADLSRAESLLGFTPKVTFQEGIEQFCAWVRGVGPTKSDYEGSIDEMRAKGLLK